jgi:hypothetical protein
MIEHIPEVADLLAEHGAMEHQLAALAVARGAAEGTLTAAEESDRAAVATATRAGKSIPRMKAPAARAALEDALAAERAALDVLGRIRQDIGALVRERKGEIGQRLRAQVADCLTDRVSDAVNDLLSAIRDDLEPLLAEINWLNRPVTEAGVTVPRAMLNTDAIDGLPAWLDRVIASRMDESQREIDKRIDRERQEVSDEARRLRQQEFPDWDERGPEYGVLDKWKDRVEQRWREEGRTPPHRPERSYVPGYGDVNPLVASGAVR